MCICHSALYNYQMGTGSQGHGMLGGNNRVGSDVGDLGMVLTRIRGTRETWELAMQRVKPGAVPAEGRVRVKEGTVKGF